MPTRTDNFYDVSLPESQKWEEYTGSVLENFYKYRVLHYNGDCKYDYKVLAPNDPITIEVKYDERHATSGNVAVEYISRGKESGIRTTKADLHIFRLLFEDGHAENYILHTEALKEAIFNRKWFKIYHMPDSDSQNSLYLFRRHDFLEIPTIHPIKNFNSSIDKRWEHWYNYEKKEVEDKENKLRFITNPFKI